MITPPQLHHGMGHDPGPPSRGRPTAYREMWGLRRDYPLTALSSAAQRSELAKKIGLGAKGRGTELVAKRPTVELSAATTE